VQELRRLGLIEWDSKQVTIRDWQALARLGDFSDDYLQLPMGVEDSPRTKVG
jgi:hypothetical protein